MQLRRGAFSRAGLNPRPAGLLSAVALVAVAPATNSARAGDAAVDVTITDKGCEPNALTVAPGKTSFKVRNASRRAVEWEILKGVDVVEERENMLPGFVQTLTATLQPGNYQITCGLLSNPKGSLKVEPSSGAAAAPSPMDLVGPLAAYKAYVAGEVDALVASTDRLVDAVKAGNLETAKSLYAPAHARYERVEPVAELFNDLDGSLDSREDQFEKKANDPAFTGFHRIEKGLFADGSTEGLGPLAERLKADVSDLRHRVAGLTITPKAMVGGAANLLEEVGSKKISGEEDRYSRTDLWDFQANLDGAQEIVALLRPLVAPRNPALDTRVGDNFKKVDAILARYRAPGGGFVSYEKLSSEDRMRLKGPVTALAEDLSTLRGTLGIE